MASKKSKECIEMEIHIDEFFELLNDGYIGNYTEIEYIYNYLRSKLEEFEDELY